VYAFDADVGGAYLWKTSLIPALSGTVDEINDCNCQDIEACHDMGLLCNGSQIGITGSPVIDLTSNVGNTTEIKSGTLYVVAATKSPAGCSSSSPPCTFAQTLYALDVTSGAKPPM
jgi:hypothetical protein